MRWRFSQLNWTYGLGELLIVIAGVLIALAIDQWNADRLSRIEEKVTIERLLVDLSEDLRSLDFEASMVGGKEASLLRVRAALRGAQSDVEDPQQFLLDVTTGSRYGWQQAVARAPTYNEMLSAGRFSIIRSAELRALISDYYVAFESRSQRIDERETSYPLWTYRLVPRVYGDAVGAIVELDRDLIEPSIDSVIARVFSSGIGEEVDAELNVGRFISAMGKTQRAMCVELIDALESYLDGL